MYVRTYVPLSITDTLVTLGNSLLVVTTLDVVNRVGLWNNCPLLYNSSLSRLDGCWCLDFCKTHIHVRISKSSTLGTSSSTQVLY